MCWKHRDTVINKLHLYLHDHLITSIFKAEDLFNIYRQTPFYKTHRIVYSLDAKKRKIPIPARADFLLGESRRLP